jgi:CheY-like chemotaxis protein/GAF domain-containing protein
MLNQTLAIIYLLCAVGLSVFLLYRLNVAGAREAGGRGLLYSGLILIVVSAVIHLVRTMPGYPAWFVEGAYPGIQATQAIIFIAGLILAVIGLVFFYNYWSERDVEVANHLEKLKLLDTLQQESHYPYPMMELLDRILKGLLNGLGEQAGAIFLYNQKKRTFILATSAGLKKEEIALLEYYPYGHNIVSQAIEDEKPMITSDFRSLGGKAQLAASSFRSILVVPLKSGRSAQGAMLFFSTEEKRYGREYIATILPIAEWLVEKIEVSRLSQELKKTQNEIEAKGRIWEETSRRLNSLLATHEEKLTVDTFARRCLGMAGADEVWLLGMADGKLAIYGGTGNKPDFSENFKTALINAIGNGRAVILNQEGTDESGQSFIARASIFMPINKSRNAILLRNNSGPIRLTEEELHVLETVAAVAGIVLGRETALGLGNSRSRGFEIISRVLRMTFSITTPEKSIVELARLIESLLPDESLQLLFERRADRLGVARANVESEAVGEISLALGEGSTGRAAVLRRIETAFGTDKAGRELLEFDDESRGLLKLLIGDRGAPVFMADYPVIIGDIAAYVLSVYVFGGSSASHAELHRLISVIIGLANLKLDISSAGRVLQKTLPEMAVGTLSAGVINELNNDLLAISGHCQLALREPNLDGALGQALSKIEQTSQDMAERLKNLSQHTVLDRAVTLKALDINAEIRRLLDKTIISGDLYMIDSRPYEVSFLPGDIPGLAADVDVFGEFIRGGLKAFAHGVGGDEVITISTYKSIGHIYIDISKHRKNFPPVEAVSGFGRYKSWEAAGESLPDPSLKKFLSLQNGAFAFDRFSETPSYFSFRFPSAPGAEVSAARRRGRAGLTILAIDDQAIILDLLAAMCQSLGHEIVVSRDSEDGLHLLKKHHPDVVIIDMAMPGMSGLELAARLKAVSGDTPIIMITGWGVQIESERLARAGVDHILHKPFRLEQLSEIINNLPISRL